MPKISFRLTDSEHAEMTAAAEAAGITVSEYVRRCITGQKVTAKPIPLPILEAEAVRHLAAIGGLLKQLWKEGRGADKALYETVKTTAEKIKERYR